MGSRTQLKPIKSVVREISLESPSFKVRVENDDRNYNHHHDEEDEFMKKLLDAVQRDQHDLTNSGSGGKERGELRRVGIMMDEDDADVSGGGRSSLACFSAPFVICTLVVLFCSLVATSTLSVYLSARIRRIHQEHLQILESYSNLLNHHHEPLSQAHQIPQATLGSSSKVTSSPCPLYYQQQSTSSSHMQNYSYE